MKLARTEYGELREDAFPCRFPGCKRKPIASGDGFALPFCKAHTEKLPRRVFAELVALAPVSVFDSVRAAHASIEVQAAIRRLVGARRQR